MFENDVRIKRDHYFVFRPNWYRSTTYAFVTAGSKCTCGYGQPWRSRRSYRRCCTGRCGRRAASVSGIERLLMFNPFTASLRDKPPECAIPQP
eukprot:6212754-Pleurochrysis_carterae.AAC.2